MVYQNSRRVGLLERATSAAVSFVYDPDWLGEENPSPIYWSLPLREQAYKGSEVVSFFENLLPDNIE